MIFAERLTVTRRTGVVAHGINEARENGSGRGDDVDDVDDDSRSAPSFDVSKPTGEFSSRPRPPRAWRPELVLLQRVNPTARAQTTIAADTSGRICLAPSRPVLVGCGAVALANQQAMPVLVTDDVAVFYSFHFCWCFGVGSSDCCSWLRSKVLSLTHSLSLVSLSLVSRLSSLSLTVSLSLSLSLSLSVSSLVSRAVSLSFAVFLCSSFFYRFVSVTYFTIHDIGGYEMQKGATKIPKTASEEFFPFFCRIL